MPPLLFLGAVFVFQTFLDCDNDTSSPSYLYERPFIVADQA